MGRSFRVRLAALHLAAVATSLALVGVAAIPLVRNTFVELATRNLEEQARLIAASLPSDTGRLESLVERAGLGAERITLLAPDGRVLADSHFDPDVLVDQGEQPEVAAARRTGVGAATRADDPSGRPLLYVAVRVEGTGPGGASPAGFVRLASPLSQLEALLRRITLLLGAGLLVGAALGLAAAHAVSRRLRARAAALAAFARAVARGGPLESPPARLQPAGDELGALETLLAATAGDLRAYVAALAEQRRRIGAIVDSMNEGVIVTTSGGEVLLMNRVAEQLLGVRPDAWRGRQLLELTRHPDLHALLERAAADDGRAAGALRLAGPQEAELAVSVAPLLHEAEGPPGADGQAARVGLGHVVVLRDVTRLKKLERARTDFVANVSHELKTPLAAIRASLETLADWALEDPAGARRYVAICLTHAERLQRLIDDLLALSNLELGQVRLSPQPVEVGPAVDETFALLAPKAQARGVRLVGAVPADWPPLLADRNRLLQILLNLVDNGIKFTPKGGTVTVSAEPADGQPAAGGQPPAGRWGAIVVADTGVGIPKADLPRIGERFYRVEKGRSREAGGTGLGLAIVKHLVQLHGGRLEIASEAGRGTTVRVILPHAVQEAVNRTP